VALPALVSLGLLAASGAWAQNAGDFLAGRHADIQQDTEKAALYYERALASDPGNPYLLNRAFVLEAGEGRFDKAVPLALQIQDSGPENTTALVVLAVDHFARNKIALAEEFVEQLPEKGLSELIRPPLSAWLALARSNPDAALESLEAFDSLAGTEDIKMMHRALISDLAGRVEDAGAIYEELLAKRDRVAYRTALMVGNYYERSGAPDKALALYERAGREAGDETLFLDAIERLNTAGAEPPPALIRTPQEGLSETLLDLATLFRRQRASDVAQVFARLALHLRPDFPEAQLLLGEVYQDQDRPEKAIEEYGKIPEGDPLGWSVRLRMAEEMVDLDKVEDALATLDGLAASRPDRYEPLFRKGNILRVEQRFEEAASAYSGALERIAAPDRRHWPLLYFRGIAYEQSDQWPEAEADFLAALDLEPDQPLVMNYLAYSWVEQKENLDRAQEMLRRAVDLRPSDGYIVDSLGWVYYRLGKFELAVKELERAVELRPQDPTINDHLGDAYWQVGRKREARFQWQRALGLEPGEEEAPKIELKLEEGLKTEPKDI
jgi:tetratricopeptide (TPR) repeat protein